MGMVDVSKLEYPPVIGHGFGGRRTVFNYRSKRFGVCDMCVETVEPEPMQESLIYLLKRSLNFKP